MPLHGFSQANDGYFFFLLFSFICIQNSIPNHNIENEQNIRYVYILSNKQ